MLTDGGCARYARHSRLLSAWTCAEAAAAPGNITDDYEKYVDAVSVAACRAGPTPSVVLHHFSPTHVYASRLTSPSTAAGSRRLDPVAMYACASATPIPGDKSYTSVELKLPGDGFHNPWMDVTLNSITHLYIRTTRGAFCFVEHSTSSRG